MFKPITISNRGNSCHGVLHDISKVFLVSAIRRPSLCIFSHIPLRCNTFLILPYFLASVVKNQELCDRNNYQCSNYEPESRREALSYV